MRKDLVKKKKDFLKKLNNNGIETRPIISGNFLNQPSIDLFKLNTGKKQLKKCQELENRGFFIGLHTDLISNKRLNFLVTKLLEI